MLGECVLEDDVFTDTSAIACNIYIFSIASQSSNADVAFDRSRGGSRVSQLRFDEHLAYATNRPATGPIPLLSLRRIEVSFRPEYCLTFLTVQIEARLNTTIGQTGQLLIVSKSPSQEQ